MTRDAVEHFPKASNSMRREMYGKGHGVDDPTEDRFDCSPAEISLPKLFKRDRFPTRGIVVFVQWPNNRVNCVEKGSPGASDKWALGSRDKSST
jgi:hypothetical protein